MLPKLYYQLTALVCIHLCQCAYNLPQGIHILTGSNHFSKYRNSPLIFPLAE